MHRRDDSVLIDVCVAVFSWVTHGTAKRVPPHAACDSPQRLREQALIETGLKACSVRRPGVTELRAQFDRDAQLVVRAESHLHARRDPQGSDGGVPFSQVWRR